MEFFDVIEQRYSMRGFEDKEVEKEKLDKILEAARLAPTGVNFQPFRVVVIDTEKYADELKEIYPAEWFLEAPLALCVVASKERAWTRKFDGKNIADIDATIVMTHIILAAEDLGLNTCFIAAFKPDKAKEFLALDDEWEPVLFTPLGYGNAEPRDTPRREIEELVIYKD
ncbi:nitroreductase family protein [uncultured Methanobrevibacter sp.]|uniref:nitroreductase family protein n=1 Tax=uncultured Methanobrevibacter sp. TaxID=253161 RepID=UPI00262671E4